MDIRKIVEHYYLKSPIMHSSTPTMRANNIASSVYNSLDESAMSLKTLETRRETKATGPIASWRDDPKVVYTNIGTKPESALQDKHGNSRVTKEQMI